ncbi:hypothetical protein [Streptomyces sp. AV19]|uniref:hypothetical protein n=1 Tax=Streptomyces sp. AV19 TaxID=2793068 RepID=UPI0024131FA5|nr:hypothetical protein [Streptomyces sp. AV19]MDG4532309.1 hypothetical protein [Streptomyces sp. AV19]
MDISAARLRALRAALFTALCVVLSASSHVLLSGRPLPPPAVAAVTAAVFGLAYALAGRERRYGSIAALLVPLELAAGAVLTTGQDTCYGADGRPLPGALTLICGGGGMGGPLASLGSGTGPWLVLGGHVATGLLAAAWLSRGEAALGRLLRAAATAAFRPLRLLVAALAPADGLAPVRPVRRAVPARRGPPLLHSVVRRGPPGLTVPA